MATFLLVTVSLGFCDATSAVIALHTFSLLTETGESVLHAHFDRRRLADRSIDQLALKFRLHEHEFDFRFFRSRPLFASSATIKVTGSVSKS